MEVTCATCRWYSDGHYECRVNPPVLLSEGKGDNTGAWPAVDDFDWCGKYETRIGLPTLHPSQKPPADDFAGSGRNPLLPAPPLSDKAAALLRKMLESIPKDQREGIWRNLPDAQESNA